MANSTVSSCLSGICNKFSENENLSELHSNGFDEIALPIDSFLLESRLT